MRAWAESNAAASTLLRPCPTPAMAVACRDVEAATLARDGSPPITRTTFPTCRAHYPGGSSGCACRLLPRSCSLPHLTARQIAQPPEAAFVTRLQPFRLPGRAARQLPDQSTTLCLKKMTANILVRRCQRFGPMVPANREGVRRGPAARVVTKRILTATNSRQRPSLARGEAC